MNFAWHDRSARELGGGGRGERAATSRAERPNTAAARRRGAAVAAVAVALSLALAASLAPWHDGHAPPHQITWLLPAAHADHMTPCDTTHNTGSRIHTIGFDSPNGVYFESETIVIRVVAVGAGYWPTGIPNDLSHTLIALETGDLDRLATYNGGEPARSSLPYFLYNYTVQRGDLSKDLDYNASDALYWRVGTGSNLQAVLGGPYQCRLPPQSSGSLAAVGDIAVIGVPKQDAYVRGHSPDRAYGVGDTVTVAVEFGEDAVYSGADPVPGLLLNVSGAQRATEFWKGNNSETFLFNYTLRPGDNTGDLGYWGRNALTGSISNLTGSPLDLTLPSLDTLSFLSDINFTTPLAVESVSSASPTGVYGLGDTIRVWVAFSDAVNVTGTPTLELGTGGAGGTNRSAAYATGTGTQRLAFDYTVQAGDFAGNLGYSGGGALSGNITDASTGEPAGLALPEPGGAPLSAARPVLVDHAAPVLIQMSSAVNGTDDFAGLGGVRRVSAIEADGAQYLLAGADAIQLIRVHENGTMKAADSARNGTDSFDSLGNSWGIKAFAIGDSAYAIVTSFRATTGQGPIGNDGVQLIRVDGSSGTLEAAGSLRKAGDASLLLDGAFGVDVVEAGAGDGRVTYALVTSNDDKGAQLIRVHGDGRLEAAGSVQSDENGGSLANFTRPYSVDAFRLENGSARVLVTDYTNNTLHLLGVDGTGGLEALSQAKHNTGGFTLSRPDSVASFVQAGERRALVGGEPGYLQLVRVHDGNGTMAPVSAVRDNGPEGFVALDKVRGLAVFGAGSGGTYAVSTAEDENSVQLARVGADGALLPVDSIVAPVGPIAQAGLLSHPQGVDTFSLGGRAYAAVTSEGGGSVTLFRLTLASVESVSSPNATGAHAAGAPIHVNVTFSEPVAFGSDPPRLLLAAGGTQRNATYLSGNTTSSLVFNYTVLPGDDDAALGYPAVGSLSGDIMDLDGHPANPTLPPPGPAGSLPGSPPVVLDTAGPRVLSVSSPNASRTYGIGSMITVNVTFSEPVTVTGGPAVEIRLNATATRDAEYSSGSGTPSLLFNYTVVQGDVSEGLNRTGSPIALNSDDSIRDLAGNDANLALPGQPGPLRADGDAIRVDGARPAVESVSSPDAPGPYGIGSTIRVDVNFTMPVSVAGDGRPFVVLGTGGASNGSAAYASGSGKSLRFEYAVRVGDDAPRLDYAGSSALVLNGSTIRDGAGNDADTALPAPTGSLLAGDVFIAADGVRPAAESVSTPNATGTYYTNQEVHIHASFGENVTVVGGPPALSVALDAGGPPPAQARYLSGSGTGTLVFAYDVRPGDSAAALDYAGEAALDLGGGTIRDAAGNDARPGLPAPGAPGSRVASAGIAVDGTVVSVANVTSPDANGAYAAGSRVNITVRFTEAVVVSSGPPPPSIALNAGEDARAVYRSNDGAGTLLFAYDVRPGDNAGRLAYAGGSALSPGGAAITAADGGATAHLDLPVPGLPASLSGSKAIAIDTAPPAVERVFSPNRTGAYGTGDTVHIVVLFSEDVEVSGTPLLGLETGRDAAYASGSGTASLLFLYTVVAGDLSADLDYANASALRLAGGSVADPAGNAADLELPAPGAAASLAGTSGIAVRGGTAGSGGNGGGPGPGGGPGGGPGPGGTSMCAASLSPPAIPLGRVEDGGQSDAVAQAIRSAGTLPIASVSVNATAWTDGSGRTVLPAGATSVLPAGAAAGEWTRLGGATAVPVPVEGGEASVQLRLDVPQGALQGRTSAVDASQVVTYTVSCEP